MKAVVVASVEDETGQRCVDIVRGVAGFGWVECRRDPEDAHGWRRLGVVEGQFPDATGAMTDAAAQVGWLW